MFEANLRICDTLAIHGCAVHYAFSTTGGKRMFGVQNWGQGALVLFLICTFCQPVLGFRRQSPILVKIVGGLGVKGITPSKSASRCEIYKDHIVVRHYRRSSERLSHTNETIMVRAIGISGALLKALILEADTEGEVFQESEDPPIYYYGQAEVKKEGALFPTIQLIKVDFLRDQRVRRTTREGIVSHYLRGYLDRECDKIWQLRDSKPEASHQ